MWWAFFNYPKAEKFWELHDKGMADWQAYLMARKI